MAAFSLDQVPHAEALEDLVAALFRSARYFVEARVTQRLEGGGTEILELDSVSTSYEGPIPDRVVAEAKSGKWGFPDAFKVLRWMRYLDLHKGALFVSHEAHRDPQVIRERLEPFQLRIVNLPSSTGAETHFTNAGLGAPLNEVVSLWRFSARVERTIVEKLRAPKKCNPERKGPAEVLSYLRLVNDKVFFVKDARERLAQMYNAFKEHPRLAQGIAAEIEGGVFDARTAGSTATFECAMKQCNEFTVQAAWYAEHRARLAILKAAIDLACLDEAGQLPNDLVAHLEYLGLPSSFHVGLRRLREQPHFKLYPLFWQLFLWGLGGFILLKHRDKEFELISKATGIPIDHVESSLDSYEQLFPFSGNGGWFTTIRNEVRIMKVFPVYFSGLGAAFRRSYYEAAEFSQLGLDGWTASRMGTWNNRAVELLVNGH